MREFFAARVLAPFVTRRFYCSWPRVLAAAFALVAALPLAAQSTSSWTGSASSDWGDSANWTNGVPNSTLDAVATAAGAPPLVLGSYESAA